MQADLRCLLEHLLNEEGVLELERAGHHPRVLGATSLPRPVLLWPQRPPSCGLGLPFFKASVWQRLLEDRRSVQNQKYGWCLPNANVLSSSWWVYREDLTLNLLIRTNYAKITLKPCLIDDNSGNSFKYR